MRFARHPARVERLPPDAPADRRHPAAASRRSNGPTTSASSRSAATATRSNRWCRRWYDALVRRRRRARTPRHGRSPDGAGRPRSGAGAGDAAVPGALRRSAGAAGRSRQLDPRALPDLRLGDRLRGDHAGRGSPAVLRPLRRAVGFAPLTCPFCANDDRALITSFATRDGRYRVYACDVCRRYLKAYDARHAHAAGDGRGGYDRDAAARRGSDAARLHG